MSTNIEKLLIIQDRDRRILRLQREIAEEPARKALIETQLDTFKKSLSNAEESLRKGELEQKDLEAQIQSRQERIQKIRQQQFEVKNNDDYRAFEKEIGNIQQEIKDIEDRELALMESMEKLSAVRDEKRKALDEEANLVKEELGILVQRKTNLEQELKETDEKRAALVADCDPEWLERYDRIFKNKGDYAIVTVEKGTCGGCHMKLPPQVIHDARKGDFMTLCMYCGRLLYSAS